MPERAGGRTVLIMTSFDRELRAGRETLRASSLIWNAVVPVLALALLLGAPVLPALAVAAVASLAIHAMRQSGAHAPLAPRRVARGH